MATRAIYGATVSIRLKSHVNVLAPTSLAAVHRKAVPTRLENLQRLGADPHWLVISRVATNTGGKHAVEINISILIMMHDQAKCAGVRSNSRLGNINIPAKPDLRAIPDSANLGARRIRRAETTRSLLPVSIVELACSSNSPRALSRVSPGSLAITGGGNERY